MKRFVSLMLVAILIVASMSMAVFAAEAGQTVNVTVTVKGDLSSYKVVISDTSVLDVTSVSVSGGVWNEAKGIVAWASATNVTNPTFTATVKIADNAKPGTYNLDLSVVGAKTNVEDGIVDVSASAYGSVTIECDHNYVGEVTKEATCEEDGVMTYTCSKCGDSYTEVIPAHGHDYSAGYKYDEDGHWHECANCGFVTEKDAHVFNKNNKCGICGYQKDVPTEKPTEKPTQKPTEKPTQKPSGEKDDVPATGDITGTVYMTGIVVLALIACAVAFVIKRRNVR